MDKRIFEELIYYTQILEEHFHDMMDVDFTVENGKMYILSACYVWASLVCSAQVGQQGA